MAKKKKPVYKSKRTYIYETSQESLYSVEERNGAYYINRSLVYKTHALYPYLEKFSKHSKRIRTQKVSAGPGIYAIYADNKIVYIGQSFNVEFRVSQHQWHLDRANNNQRTYGMYNEIVKSKDVKFKILVKFDVNEFKKLTYDQQRDLLCLGEQWGFDTFKPELNTIASRRTRTRCKRAR